MLNKQLKKALYNCCQPDKEFKYDSLKGLLHTEGKIVASDTHVLAVVTHEYDPVLENVIIDRRGETIKLEYPRWKGVLPVNESEFLQGPSFTDLAAACKALIRQKSKTPIFLSIHDITFDPAVLLPLIAVFDLLEENPVVSVRNTASPEDWTNNRAMFNSENCTAIVCSTNLFGEVTPVSVSDAIKVGDLL